MVPRSTARHARRKSSPVGHSRVILLAMTARCSAGRARFEMISPTPKMPIANVATSMPSVRSLMSKVKRVPPGYRVVARRGPVAVDGMEHESRPIFGFQFHPEAREEFLLARGLDPAELGVEARAECDGLVDAFRRLVAQDRPAADGAASRRRSQHRRT